VPSCVVLVPGPIFTTPAVRAPLASLLRSPPRSPLSSAPAVSAPLAALLEEPSEQPPQQRSRCVAPPAQPLRRSPPEQPPEQRCRRVAPLRGHPSSHGSAGAPHHDAWGSVCPRHAAPGLPRTGAELWPRPRPRLSLPRSRGRPRPSPKSQCESTARVPPHPCLPGPHVGLLHMSPNSPRGAWRPL